MDVIRYLQLALLSLVVVSLNSCCNKNEDKMKDNIAFQYSTINALMNGYYYGGISVAEIKEKGDFGLGTFDALDGEMIIIDGKVYKVAYPRKVIEVADEETSPFVNVVKFNPTDKHMLRSIDSIDILEELLLTHISNPNIIYAFRISGVFNFLKVRTLKKQKEPYPTLTQVIDNEDEKITPYTENVPGDIIGFYFPEYYKDIGVAGFHFHFISDDRTIGGHLKGCKADSALVQIGVYTDFMLEVPNNETFSSMNLSVDEGALDSIERDTNKN